MKSFIIILVIALGLVPAAKAQVPVELFAGENTASIDLMFFKFFKKRDGSNSKFLFFNRNRASINYEMTATANLPTMGFTEAISYNDQRLKGFAPVMVGQVLSWGVFPKAGVQFVRTKENFTFFSWVVIETLKNPEWDQYFMVRYTPPITSKLHLFTQFESLNIFPTKDTDPMRFFQRGRLGIQVKTWQIGAGIDSSQSGRDDFSFFHQLGGFLRHNF